MDKPEQLNDEQFDEKWLEILGALCRKRDKENCAWGEDFQYHSPTPLEIGI